MTEKAARQEWACRALFQIGYVIRPRDGFTKFIQPAECSLVLRLLADRPRVSRSFKMLRSAPETVTQAHLPGVGR